MKRPKHMFRQDRGNPLPAISLPNPEGFPIGVERRETVVHPRVNFLPPHPDPYDKAEFAGPKMLDEHECRPVMQAEPQPGWGFDTKKAIALVPVASYVDLDCDVHLRALESTGIRVDRLKGSSAIDFTRCVQATKVMNSGFEQLLFIDSDMIFDPADAIKFFQSDEPVIGAVYAAKRLNPGQMNVAYDPSVREVAYGDTGDGAKYRLYPAVGLGAGFLRIKIDVLRRMVKELNLPLCHFGGDRAYPFFMPMIRQFRDEELPRYWCEDYAFCHRCRDMGVIPKADATVRTGHMGGYPYMWEEGRGDYIPRERSLHQSKI